MVDNSDGDIAAHYEYDPFGNEITSIGDLAQSNVYRFSTKYYDEEVNLYYYGYRYYSPELGRWINRDPLYESGGLNLQSFIFNNSVSFIDLLGLKIKCCGIDKYLKDNSVTAYSVEGDIYKWSGNPLSINNFLPTFILAIICFW